MARPITWQDVAPPTGGAAAVEATLRSGEVIGNAFRNLGGVATQARDDITKAATGAAIASIANSDDPAAAAAAAPQSWEFDPLAIAQATNARKSQLQDARMAEQNILASQANIRASDSTVLSQEATRKDLEDKRLGAELAQPYLNLVNSGKFKGVDPADFEGKGQGGIYAQEAIQRALNDREELQLRARATGVAERQYRDQQARESYAGWARQFGASVEGQSLDAAELDRRLVAEAKRRGLPETLADAGSAHFEKGASVNMPTQGELDSKIPGAGGKTYRDAVGTLSQVASQVQAQKAAELAQPYDPKNPNSPSLLQLQEFAVRAPAFTEGTLSFVAGELAAKAQDMDVEEARERISQIKAKHRNLTDAQAADLALQSEDRVNFGPWDPANSPEVEAGAQMYALVDKLGRKEGVDRIIGERTYKFDKRLSELPGLARQLSASSRSGSELPAKLIEWDAEIARETATTAQKAAAEKAAAAEAELARARALAPSQKRNQAEISFQGRR